MNMLCSYVVSCVKMLYGFLMKIFGFSSCRYFMICWVFCFWNELCVSLSCSSLCSLLSLLCVVLLMFILYVSLVL